MWVRTTYQSHYNLEPCKEEICFYPLLKIKILVISSFGDSCTPMFIEALFTIAKISKQPKYPLRVKWIKENVVYTYYGILFSHRKEENPAICDNRDRPGHYDKCNKPKTEKQILHELIHTWLDLSIFYVL